MASQRQDHPLRGLLIPDTRLGNVSLSTGGGDHTEQGPRAGGVAVAADSKSKVVFETAGDQDQSILIEVADGGYPGDMSYLYQFGAGTNKGWNAPNMITGFNRFIYDYTVYNTYSLIDVIEQGDGKLLSSFSDGTAAYLYTFDPGTETVAVLTAPVTNYTGSTALCRAPDDYILLITRVTDVGWTLWRSGAQRDASGGFDQLGQNIFADVPTGTASRARLLYAKSTNELVYFHMGSTLVEQYTSTSGGAKFTQIDSFSGLVSPADQCISASGKICVLYVATTSTLLTFCSLGSGSEAITTATKVLVHASTTYDECWLYADPAGPIYAYGRKAGVDTVETYRSIDDGTTWVLMNSGVYASSVAGDAVNYITGGRIVHSRGAGWWIHQRSSTNGTASVGIAKLGGFGDIVLKPYAASYQEIETTRPSFGINSLGDYSGTAYVPISSLSNIDGWTTTLGAGATSRNVETDGAMHVRDGAGGGAYFTKSLGTDRAIVALVDMATTTGSTATHIAGVSIRASNGATGSEIALYTSATALNLVDKSSGASLATLTIGLTTFMQFMFCWEQNNSRLEVYYKRPTDTGWTSLYQRGTALTVFATATSQIQIGNTTASVGHSSWRFIGVASAGSGALVKGIWGARLSTDSTYVRTRMLGRLASVYPAPLWDKTTVAGNYGGLTFLRVKDGPAQDAELFTSEPAYDFPASNIDCIVSPSPRVKHRTTAVSPVTTIVPEQIFEWSPSDGARTSLSQTVGIAVLGANYRYAYFEGNDGGGWDTLCTLDLAKGFISLDYVRTGNVIRIDTTSIAGERYVWRNELVGGHVDLDGLGQVYRIVRHTEGIWGTASAKHVEIIIDSVEVAEGGTDAPPASGALNIWFPSGVVTTQDLPDMYYSYRVRIPTQYTREGYLATGIILPGFVQTFGLQHSWGTNYKFETNAESFQSRSGTTRRRALGPVIPSWNIAWTDEQDLSRLRDTDPTPNFLSFVGDAEGMANYMDVPYLMSGLLEELKSGEIPVVAIAEIRHNSTIHDPTMFLYGRIVSSVQIENVQGNEGEDEVHRTQSITIEGIV